MSPHVAPWDEALRAIVFILGWNGGIMEVQSWAEGRSFPSHFITMGQPDSGRRVARWVRMKDERQSAEVLLGVPAARRAGGVRTATAFWARVEGTEQNRWLERFRPVPTIVLREGTSSRRWCLWALEHEVKWQGVDRGNRRISHRLRAPKKHAEPERLWLPAPGSCLRRGKSKPVPVVVERLGVESYRPLDVVGRLPDAPATDAWLKGAARG